jgi:hypothetical protein
MEDLIHSPDDNIDVEPVSLSSKFMAVLTSALAKNLASNLEKPWTEDNESKMQEKISELVAAANEQNLKEIKVIVTGANGETRTTKLDIDRINKTRSLQ